VSAGAGRVGPGGRSVLDLAAQPEQAGPASRLDRRRRAVPAGRYLHKAGGNIAVDGQFGQQTERRVKDLQGFFGLTVDGWVGGQTWGVVDMLAGV
jgi:peptidoglycan hydrolase-like protein with peptidoglycan-binding domain